MPKSTQCGFLPGGPHPPEQLLTIHGPTLIVDIGFDPNFVAGQQPTLGAKGVHALVDTGAGVSFIDDALAQSLGLPLVDKQHVSGSNGRHEVNMYLGHIFIPSLNFTIQGRFGGVGLSAGGQRHAALIGRAFLQHFKMTYNGITGEVELSQP